MAELDDLMKILMDTANGAKKSTSEQDESRKTSDNEAHPNQSSGAARPDIASMLPLLTSMLGGSGGNSDSTMGMITSLLPILSEFGNEDETTRLLSALKPFLNQKRSANVDTAVSAAKMMRVARAATKIKDDKGGNKDGL